MPNNLKWLQNLKVGDHVIERISFHSAYDRDAVMVDECATVITVNKTTIFTTRDRDRRTAIWFKKNGYRKYHVGSGHWWRLVQKEGKPCPTIKN